MVMLLYCDVLVLVCMELDFGELVCNQLVSNCREQNAQGAGLGEALDEGHGGVLGGVQGGAQDGVQDGVLDGEGGWVREADSWVLSCSSSCGAPALEVESEGLEGRWTCQSSSKPPQDSSGESL